MLEARPTSTDYERHAPMQSESIAARECVMCGHAFTQRPDERTDYYLLRTTCSHPCRVALRQRSNIQVRLQQRRERSTSVAAIPVGLHHFALVDREDFERVIALDWHPRVTDHTVYAAAKIDSRLVRLHRFVLGAACPALVDHINRIGLDCRKANLRPATHTENAINRKRDIRNTSGYKGVSWHGQAQKWRALIKVGDVWHSLGLHATPEDAARAYDAAARQHFGEYARLNFPEAGEQAA